MRDLAPSARVAFAGAYLALQAALVLTAGRRTDGAFGFRLFRESSVVSIALSREVRAASATGGEPAVVAPVADGTWVAHDAGGRPRRIDIRDRVHQRELTTFNAPVRATAGASAALARLQSALDDVIFHLDDDAETRALVADVEVQINGREPYVVRLRSERP